MARRPVNVVAPALVTGTIDVVEHKLARSVRIRRVVVDESSVSPGEADDTDVRWSDQLSADRVTEAINEFPALRWMHSGCVDIDHVPWPTSAAAAFCFRTRSALPPDRWLNGACWPSWRRPNNPRDWCAGQTPPPPRRWPSGATPRYAAQVQVRLAGQEPGDLVDLGARYRPAGPDPRTGDPSEPDSGRTA
jgi:hypothetical protein